MESIWMYILSANANNKEQCNNAVNKDLFLNAYIIADVAV